MTARALAAAGFLLATVIAWDQAEARQWSWLGVRIRDMSEQEMEDIASRHGIREGFGVIVVEVIADTPAARAGLKSGDIVVAFGERPVVETRLLQRLIASAPTDRETNLTILRPDGRRAVRVRLTSMPPSVAGERVAAEFGFAVREVAELAEVSAGRVDRPARQLDAGAGTPAVAVVARDGPAAKAGLEVGDVILRVGERAVVDANAAREALAEREPDRPLTLTVRRRERQLSVTLVPSP